MTPPADPQARAVRNAVKACAAYREAQRNSRAAVEARDAAFRAVVDTGVPKAHVSRLVRDAMLAAGWTQEEIRQVGVGPDNLRRILDPY